MQKRATKGSKHWGTGQMNWFHTVNNNTGDAGDQEKTILPTSWFHLGEEPVLTLIPNEGFLEKKKILVIRDVYQLIW